MPLENPFRRSWKSLPMLGLLLLGMAAKAQEQTPAHAHLEAAVRHYHELEYEFALQELHEAQGRAETRQERVTTLLYQGIILFELNRAPEARAAFRAALQLQHSAVLPMRVSPKIESDFQAQREQLQRHAARGQRTSDSPTVATKDPLEQQARVTLGTSGADVPMSPATPAESEVAGSRPWFKRWYVWTAVGAVVTAAAVGAVVATRDGPREPLTPGDVCGGDCDAVVTGGIRF